MARERFPQEQALLQGPLIGTSEWHLHWTGVEMLSEIGLVNASRPVACMPSLQLGDIRIPSAFQITVAGIWTRLG